MFRVLKFIEVLVVVIFVFLLAKVGAPQQGVSPLGEAEKSNCQAVYAVGAVRKIIDCPKGKGYNFCMTRELTDRTNLITGQLAYFSGAKESVAHPHDPNTSVYAAKVMITTADGVLELKEHGLFDNKTLEFTAISTVAGGTGKFEGYSGKLMCLGYAKGKVVFMGTLCHE
jgi:hypothetical protein